MTFNQTYAYGCPPPADRYDPPTTTPPTTFHWSESAGEGALAAAVMGLTIQALTTAAQQMATAAALLVEQMHREPEVPPGATRRKGRGR